MITLYINNYGGWDWTRQGGQRAKVIFEGPNADRMAADYIARKGYLVIEEDQDLINYPLTAEALYPSCEHGLSLSLCAGPGHYPMDM